MDDLLVSDADRNAVVRQLQSHPADGRLSIDEFGDRVAEAYTARTASELRAVLRDLPQASPLMPPTAYRQPAVVRPVRRVPSMLVPILIGLVFVMIGLFAIAGLL